MKKKLPLSLDCKKCGCTSRWDGISDQCAFGLQTKPQTFSPWQLLSKPSSLRKSLLVDVWWTRYARTCCIFCQWWSTLPISEDCVHPVKHPQLFFNWAGCTSGAFEELAAAPSVAAFSNAVQRSASLHMLTSKSWRRAAESSFASLPSLPKGLFGNFLPLPSDLMYFIAMEPC